MNTFVELLNEQWDQKKFLCIGLDPDMAKISALMRGCGTRLAITLFNRMVINATHDLVCAYKPNLAFYASQGNEGLSALRDTIEYVARVAPRVPVILDAKYADIDSTSMHYARTAFEHFCAHAVTVNPYLGGDSLSPFFAHKDKGVIVLTHTSNPGSKDFQERERCDEPLYRSVARNTTYWNTNGNAAVMVGATYPRALKVVRDVVGDIPILIAGIGAQKGSLEESVRNGINSKKRGIIVSASRSILYASSGDDFAEAARASALLLSDAITAAIP